MKNMPLKTWLDTVCYSKEDVYKAKQEYSKTKGFRLTFRQCFFQDKYQKAEKEYAK